jgi:hypothetical protein
MKEPHIKWRIGEEMQGNRKRVMMSQDQSYTTHVTVHDDSAARSVGLRGGFVVNEYQFAQITQMLIENFGPAWFTNGEIEIKYISPLTFEDTFIPGAKVSGIEGDLVKLEVWGENQEGKKVAIGKAGCIIRSK